MKPTVPGRHLPVDLASLKRYRDPDVDEIGVRVPKDICACPEGPTPWIEEMARRVVESVMAI